MAILNKDDIQKYYGKMLAKRTWLDKIATYVEGENYNIKHQEDAPKPDNRIPVPLAKSAITDIVGYAGRPGEIKTEYTRKDAEDNKEVDKIEELFSSFDNHNKEGIENSELLAKSLSFGIAWELWWVSDDLELKGGVMTPEYKILDNRECYPIYDGNLKPKLTAFIRFHADEDKKIADIYYPGYSHRWIKSKDGKDWVQEINEVTGSAEYTTYPYKEVPVIPFRSSMNNQPVFIAQKPIIDSFDTLVSKTQNEVDRYNALITLFPGKMTKENIEKLTEALKPYIDGLEDWDADKWPKYLEKNLAGIAEFYNAQSDRLERLFHKTIKVPDMSDKEFAGDQSGVAIAYKLIGFEFLVSEIEIYFRQGLEKRLDFYNYILSDSTVTYNEDDYKQSIVWNRNLPVDAETKLRVAAMLKGLGYPMELITKFIPNNVVDKEFLKTLEEKGINPDPEETQDIPDDISKAKRVVVKAVK